MTKITTIEHANDIVRSLSRDECIAFLEDNGFGGPAITPTDWRTYYNDDELQDFVIEYIGAE